MTTKEYLLTCLAEECAEIQQRISKALRFGTEEIQPGQPRNNVDRISDEVDDFLAVCELLESTCDIRVLHNDRIAIDRKKEKVQKFMEYSTICGTLEEERIDEGNN